MGLLDAIVPFAPGGGLLDYLKRNAAASIANNPGAMASDSAQYGAQAMPGVVPANQPNAIDSAQWPQGPVGAPMNANASMVQQPAPVPQQPPAVIQAQPTAPAVGGGEPGFMTGYQNFHNGGGLIGSIIAGITGQRNDPLAQQQQQQAQVGNLTARALIAKGIPQETAMAAVQPGNTEMLKTLVTQAFGPPRAPTALGNGYIWQDGKVVRAYEPEDKTPIGFEKTKDGLRPIPGGPADPAYIRTKEQSSTDPNAVKVLGKGGELYQIGPDGKPVIVHKNEDGGAEATLSDESTKAMAAQYLAGDRTVLQNLGRGAQGAANIVKLREEITRQAHDAGLSAKDVVTTFNEQAGNLAGQRTVGTRAANISLAANEANNMIPIAVAASEAVPRGQYVPWNRAVQAVQTGSSSPELARFVAATNSLVNAYVRAVSPSGVPTDSMREHAYSMLNSAQSHQAYVAVTKIMQDEMKAALEAPAQVRKELRGEGGHGEAGSPQPAATGTTSGGVKWKVE